MREVTGNTTRLGSEPYLVVGVNWAGQEVLYAGKLDAVPGSGVQGLLLEVSGIDDVMKVSGGGSAGGVTVKLDDTAGSIAAIVDVADPHMRPVSVYQAFWDASGGSGMSLLYSGVINTPIVWDEGDRSFSFDVVTIIEDFEVGFSAEEGTFPNLPDEFIGKTWPLCFGSPTHVPGLTFQKVPVGVTLTNILVPDRTLQLYIQYDLMKVDFSGSGGLGGQSDITTWLALAAYAGDQSGFDALEQAYIDYQTWKNQQTQTNEMMIYLRDYQRAVDATMAQLTGPVTQGYTILIDKARYFPQGQNFYARIGEFVAYGQVNGDVFTFTLIQPPIPRPWPYKNADGTNGVSWMTPAWTDADVYIDENNNEAPVFNGQVSFGPHGEPIPVGYNLETDISPEGVRIIPAGSTVTIISDVTMDFLTNIIATTVTKVWAYKAVGVLRQLYPVPEKYWKAMACDWAKADQSGAGGSSDFAPQIVRLKRPLSGYAFQGWEDQIYVDQVSSVGPDIVKVMKWIIEQYTRHTAGASFGQKGISCNFWLDKRGNAVSVLSEIAYQSLYAIFLKDGVFEIVYLPGLPTGGPAVGVADIAVGTLQIGRTSTEEIVTKIRGSFRSDYAIDATDLVVIKNNVDAYGLIVQDTDYYIYNDPTGVKRALTYWISRLSQSWRVVTFKTYLPFLGVESYDCMSLTTPWVSGNGIVQTAVYDAADNSITFSLLMLSGGEAGGATTVYFPHITPVFDAAAKPTFFGSNYGGAVPLAMGGGTKVNTIDPARTKMWIAARQDTPQPDPVIDDPPEDDPNQAPSPTNVYHTHYHYTDVLPPVGSKATQAAFPGKVLSKDSGQNYKVAVYKSGTAGKPTTTVVAQLQIDTSDTIPPDTWCLVIVVPDAKGVKQYYMQVPVWLA